MSRSKPKLVRHRSLPKQVADHVRERIQEGYWTEGDRLPTARELAAEWGTDQATVHRALTLIAKEGLVDRKPRVGTFVRQQRPVLETVGLYVGSQIMRPGSALFTQALVSELQTELERQGLNVRFLIDPRAKAEQTSMTTDIEQTVARREVQAVIVPVTDPVHTAWLSKLPVPVVFFSGSQSCPVSVDQSHFFRLATESLVRQGCRRLAVISAYSQEKGNPYENFIDQVSDLGACTRDAWMEIARSGQFPDQDANHSRFGYESVLRIWAGAERPDGLIVTPDGVTMGAVTALMKLGVKVPQELRLVLQRNVGVPMLCPLPATLLYLDTRTIAAGLVKQACELHAGRTIERIRVLHELRESASR